MTKLTIIKSKLAFTRFGSTMMFPFTWTQNDDDGEVTIQDVSSDRSFKIPIDEFFDEAENALDSLAVLDLLANYCINGIVGAIDTSTPLDVSIIDLPLTTRPETNNWQNNISAFNGTADLNPLGSSSMIVKILGTFIGTFVFEVSQNGSNWDIAVAVPHSGINQTLVASVTTQGAWLVDVAGWAYFRVRCSAYTSGTANVLLNSTNSATINRSISTGQTTQPVSLASTTVTSISAGTNVIGDFGIQVRANATGAGNATTLNCPAAPVGQSIKATAGRILGIYINNSSATLRWLKVFNTASVTMGTTAAVLDIPIPPSNNTQFISFPAGIGASTAIVLAITGAKGLTNNTAVTLDDVSGFISWA
jgi:hypothetical protein